MKQPHAFPELGSHSAKLAMSHHQARVARYGIELTEIIESLPPTADLIERQEARTLIQPFAEDE